MRRRSQHGGEGDRRAGPVALRRREPFVDAPTAGELAPSVPPARSPQPPRPVHGSDAIAGVQAVADELVVALNGRLGPGCSAAPALSWDGARYDTRAIAIEVPASSADRLLADLRTAGRAERLMEELYAGGSSGAERTMARARALRARRESVRGRLGRLQVGRRPRRWAGAGRRARAGPRRNRAP